MTVCEWCGAEFAPSSLGQKYCNALHKHLAKKARQEKRDGEPYVAPQIQERPCAWCKRPFIPTDEVQLYCTPRHAKNARARRAAMEEAGTNCPRPDKRAYSSATPAYRAVKKMGRDDLEAYPCVCGAWHVGSVPEWMTDRRNHDAV